MSLNPVSPKNPCPICKHSKRCMTSLDGALAMCYRVVDEAYFIRQDKLGSTYGLHRLATAMNHASIGNVITPEQIIADSKTLDEVYAFIIARLPLSDMHREQLLARGLTDEAITTNCYRSYPPKGRDRIADQILQTFQEKASTVPGYIRRKNHGKWRATLAGPSGLLIPIRNLAGEIIALKVRVADSSLKCNTLRIGAGGGSSWGPRADCPGPE